MAVTPELVQYVARSRRMGMSDEAIRSSLLKTGWNIDDVNAVIPVIMPSQFPPQSPEAKELVIQPKKRKTGLILFIIFLLSLGGAVYYFFPQIKELSLKYIDKDIFSRQPSAEDNEAVTGSVPFVVTSTEGWQVYASEKYAFEVKYPPEWKYQELVQGPEGVSFCPVLRDCGTPENVNSAPIIIYTLDKEAETQSDSGIVLEYPKHKYHLVLNDPNYRTVLDFMTDEFIGEGWKNYKDETNGFIFRYPSHWQAIRECGSDCIVAFSQSGALSGAVKIMDRDDLGKVNSKEELEKVVRIAYKRVKDASFLVSTVGGFEIVQVSNPPSGAIESFVLLKNSVISVKPGNWITSVISI